MPPCPLDVLCTPWEELTDDTLYPVVMRLLEFFVVAGRPAPQL